MSLTSNTIAITSALRDTCIIWLGIEIQIMRKSNFLLKSPISVEQFAYYSKTKQNYNCRPFGTLNRLYMSKVAVLKSPNANFTNPWWTETNSRIEMSVAGVQNLEEYRHLFSFGTKLVRIAENQSRCWFKAWNSDEKIIWSHLLHITKTHTRDKYLYVACLVISIFANVRATYT